MSIITKMRKQKAIWWERTTPDRFGRFSFEAPVEVDCRWDDTLQEIVDDKGEKSISKAMVFVDRVMVPGDRLKRGDLESDTPADPLTITDAHEIKRFDQNPNFRATETLYTAYL